MGTQSVIQQALCPGWEGVFAWRQLSQCALFGINFLEGAGFYV